MNKELYVSSTPHETKVALVEDDQLAEVFYERENEYTLAGSIYKGRVTRVLPGMQSAFVDIGLDRDAFLYVSDFLELTDEEESEEFGQIPAPVAPVNVGPTTDSGESNFDEGKANEQAEFVARAEEFASPASEDDREVIEGQTSQGEEPRVAEGTRRWRGRRRRGGRRGGREEREQRTEPRNGAAETTDESDSTETVVEDRPAPPRYTPIVLPGESISKYRNLGVATHHREVVEPDTKVEESTVEVPEMDAAKPVEDFVASAETATLEKEQVNEVAKEETAALRVVAQTLDSDPASSVATAEDKGEPIVAVSKVEVEPPGLEAMEATNELVRSTETVQTSEYGTVEVGNEPKTMSGESQS